NAVALILAVSLGLAALVLMSLAFPLLQSNVFQGIPSEYLLVALLLLPVSIYQLYWNAMMIGLNRVLLLNKLNLGLNLSNTLLMTLAVGVFHLGIPGFLAV